MLPDAADNLDWGRGPWFALLAAGLSIAAGFIGLGMGGIQSLSRSTYSKLIDVKYSTSYFSFYDVSQKLSIVLGTALYATMDVFTGSIRLCLLYTSDAADD